MNFPEEVVVAAEAAEYAESGIFTVPTGILLDSHPSYYVETDTTNPGYLSPRFVAIEPSSLTILLIGGSRFCTVEALEIVVDLWLSYSTKNCIMAGFLDCSFCSSGFDVEPKQVQLWNEKRR